MSSRQRTVYPRKPVATVMLVAAMLSLAYAGGTAFKEPGVLNKTGPIVLGAVCLWAAYITVRRAPFSLLAPLPWFFLACSFYFGLGPLAYHFATPETAAYMHSLFYVSENALLETNLLNSSAISAICFTMVVIDSLGWKPKKPEGSQPSEVRQLETHRRAMWLFLSAGVGVKYTLSLPYALGLTQWVVPGVIFHMDRLVLIALSLLIILVRRGETRYQPILYFVLVTEIATAIMTFSKTAMIMVAFAAIIGMYISGTKMRTLIALGLALILAYALVLSPFVTYARIAYRSGGAEDLQQSINAVRSYIEEREEDRRGLENVQGWWSRLCYTNAQAFVMQQYSDGLPGKTLGEAFWALVPRAIYPDKPVFAQGRELTNLVRGTGDAETHITAGVFAEAFWNGGALLVGIVSVYIGALFMLIGRFTQQKLAARQYEYLPLLMAGIMFGFSVDRWFVPTYVGSLMEWLALYLVITVIFHRIGKRYKGSRPAIP